MRSYKFKIILQLKSLEDINKDGSTEHLGENKE